VPTDWRQVCASIFVAATSAALSLFGLTIWPSLGLEFFCRGAGWLAAVMTGCPMVRVENGWMLSAASPVVVTSACSGTTYFVLLAVLFGWHVQQRVRRSFVAVGAAIACAVPTAVAVNGLRVAAVLQTHRWLYPLFPDSFRPFLHMLTGVAVFLPALIAINLACEIHGRTSTFPRN